MPKTTKSASTTHNKWEEVVKCFSEKLKIHQVTTNNTKIESVEMVIISINNTYLIMHLISKSIPLANTTCMPKQENHQLSMV
jgi:hypothetical protein